MTVTDQRHTGSNEPRGAGAVGLLTFPSDPPVDLPGVLARLDALQIIAEQQPPRFGEDGLACFNHLYREITAEVWERIQSNDFRSREFITKLDVEFAKRYFDAVVPRTDGRPVPESWQVLLERRSDPDINRIQFAVAGVNAHVDFDLAFALLTTCRDLGRPFGEDERADYNLINQVFASHMRALRQHFEDWWMRVFDRGLFALIADEGGELAVIIARDAAWNRAKRLSTLFGHEFDEESAEIDRQAAIMGRAMLDIPVP